MVSVTDPYGRISDFLRNMSVLTKNYPYMKLTNDSEGIIHKFICCVSFYKRVYSNTGRRSGLCYYTTAQNVVRKM
jgi:hypothetical protein